MSPQARGAQWVFVVGRLRPDPSTFAAVAGALVVVALTAAYVPARRAAAVDPLTALRSD